MGGKAGRRDATFWLHVALGGGLLFLAVIYGGFPLAYRLGYWEWARPTQDLFISFLVLAVAIASAAVLAGTSICYQKSRK